MKFYTNVARIGNNIVMRGYEDGVGVSRKVKYAPTLYLSCNEESNFKSFLDGKNLVPRYFESMKDAQDYVEGFKDTIGFDIYGNTNYVSQYIQEMYPGNIDYDISMMNVLYFDIEYDISTGKADINEADKEITSISLKYFNDDKYYLLGVKDYDPKLTTTKIDPKNIIFRKFKSEYDMLAEFLRIWTDRYPDIVSGWNCKYFDIMYIVTRIKRILGETNANRLSPWNRLRLKSQMIFNKEQFTYDILGVSVVDFMDAFKKFGYKYGTQESYKLDHIAHVVLNENKLDYSEYGSLTELYNQNPQLYLDYNLKDTWLIQRLEEETALISLVLTVAYMGGVNYEDAFGTIAIWESTLYRKLAGRGIIPPIKRHTNNEAGLLVGGYVKDPMVGLHKWVVSFDLNSLYPHLMMQYNMSPETFIGKVASISVDMVLDGNYRNHDQSTAICANGAGFRKDKLGIIPEVIEGYYAERKVVKGRMLDLESEREKMVKDSDEYKRTSGKITQLFNQQMSIKILMNSLYGAVANVYFQYYIGDMAEAITTSGQLSLRYAHNAVNRYLNVVLGTQDVDYIIYCVDGSTELDINGKNESIANLYDRIDTSSYNGVKRVHDRNLFTMSYNTEKNVREYKRITSIVKHTKKKKMYRVWIDSEKNIVVSEDHRFLVRRNGIIIEAIPKQLLEDDEFINIHGHTKKGVYQCMK